MDDDLTIVWRGRVDDAEMVALVKSYGGNPDAGSWDRTRPYSLGWVTARDNAGRLVGFVNVAWDGGDHAFLLDTKAHGDVRRRGIGTAVVLEAIMRAREAGCEWLHVDFDEDLSPFYFASCGFKPTAAGLVHLRWVR